MIQCPFCRIHHVANTIFCAECGTYLLESKDLGTDPLEMAEIRWQERLGAFQGRTMDLPTTESLTIYLRIGSGGQSRELRVSLIKPIRLGRTDPTQAVYPEIDLTHDLGKEYTISREHACIFQQGSDALVEALGSTNGTLLNGKRFDPYIPARLKDGDQLQLGKLLIAVSVESLSE